MKKIWGICLAVFVLAVSLSAAESKKEETVSIPVSDMPKTACVSDDKEEKKELSSAERKKLFKERRKQIKKLLKRYRKAKQSDKPAIKAELACLVSDSVDDGLSYMKEQIAQQKANLDNWQEKINKDEKNLEEIKARRLEDLLSGEAEKKHKEAKKAWKKKMKEAKKNM